MKCPDALLRALLELPDELPEVCLRLSLESFEQAPTLGMDEGPQPLSGMSRRGYGFLGKAPSLGEL